MVLCTSKLTTLILWMPTTETKKGLPGTFKPWCFPSNHLRCTLSCSCCQESFRNHSSHLNWSSFHFLCSFSCKSACFSWVALRAWYAFLFLGGFLETKWSFVFFFCSSHLSNAAGCHSCAAPLHFNYCHLKDDHVMRGIIPTRNRLFTLNHPFFKKFILVIQACVRNFTKLFIPIKITFKDILPFYPQKVTLASIT